VIGENIFTHQVEERIQETVSNPLLFDPYPPEIVGRQTQLFIGKNTQQTLIQQLLEKVGIRASPRQMDELFRYIKGPQERMDKGEAQITFYQVKKLLKELQKGYTMEEFWRLVEQITHQKPKLTETESESKQPEKSP
jgi:isopropylmalate/homocitrate/citramalate synthase